MTPVSSHRCSDCLGRRMAAKFCKSLSHHQANTLSMDAEDFNLGIIF